MRRPKAWLAGTAGAVCLVLIASVAGGSAATPGGDRHHFEVRVIGSGSATADYGEDRLTAGISTSGVDGKTSLQWRWEVRAAAFSVGAGGLVTRAEAGRERAVATASVLLWSKGLKEISVIPLCDQRQGTTTIVSDDKEGRKPRQGGKGEFVEDAYFELRGGRLSAQGPISPSLCFHGASTEDGLLFSYDGEAAVPRGAFNPRSDRDYRETFGPVELDYPRSHTTSDPNAAHTFTAESKLEVRIDSVSERRFDKLVRKYQSIPVYGGGDYETEYNEPPG